MKQESFKVLEYKRILSRLAEKAGTKLGKELALGLLPVSDSEDVKANGNLPREALLLPRERISHSLLSVQGSPRRCRSIITLSS